MKPPIPLTLFKIANLEVSRSRNGQTSQKKKLSQTRLYKNSRLVLRPCVFQTLVRMASNEAQPSTSTTANKVVEEKVIPAVLNKICAETETGKFVPARSERGGATRWWDDETLKEYPVPKIVRVPMSGEVAFGLLYSVLSRQDKINNYDTCAHVLQSLAVSCLYDTTGTDFIFPEQNENGFWKIDSTRTPYALDITPWEALLDKSKEVKESTTEALKEFASPLNDKNWVSIVKDMKENGVDMHQVRMYVGAYAAAFFRLATKEPRGVEAFFKNRVKSIIASLYRITAIDFPEPKEAFLRGIQTQYAVNTNLAAHVIFYSTWLITEAMDSPQYVSNASVLRGLFMIVIMEAALPIWGIGKRLAEKYRPLTLLQIASRCRYGGATQTAIEGLFLMTYKYIAKDADREMLKEKGITVQGITSRFWYIARLISTDYLTFVGRKGNETLLSIFIHLYDLNNAKNRINDNGYNMPETFMTPDDLKDYVQLIHEDLMKTIRGDDKSTAWKELERRRENNIPIRKPVEPVATDDELSIF